MTLGSETIGVIGAIDANAQVARTAGYNRKSVISNAFFIFLLVFSTAWPECSWSPDPKNYGEHLQLSGHMFPCTASIRETANSASDSKPDFSEACLSSKHLSPDNGHHQA
jgi:hypothetical protein